MSNIAISDLEHNANLDSKALTSIIGGHYGYCRPPRRWIRPRRPWWGCCVVYICYGRPWYKGGYGYKKFKHDAQKPNAQPKVTA